MPKTLTERMGILETKFETIVIPMAHKVDEVHKILKDNGLCKDVEDAKQAIIELQKTPVLNDNGKERRKNTWQRMPWYQKIITGGAIGAVIFRPEVATILHKLAEILEKITQ